MTWDTPPNSDEPSNGDVLITTHDGSYLVSVIPHDPLIKFKYLYLAVEFAKKFADTKKGCAIWHYSRGKTLRLEMSADKE